MSVQIRQGAINDLDDLAPLFDAYRQFYGEGENLPLAREFLLERFRHQQSTILLARLPNGDAIGFTQLYPSFSSVGCKRTYVLNDLFVVHQHRRHGVARALLEAAADFGRKMGAARLTLSTATDNEHAQAVYERIGWRCNDAFVTYNLRL